MRMKNKHNLYINKNFIGKKILLIDERTIEVNFLYLFFFLKKKQNIFYTIKIKFLLGIEKVISTSIINNLFALMLTSLLKICIIIRIIIELISFYKIIIFFIDWILAYEWFITIFVTLWNS